ncbi:MULTISPECIES: type II secretion system protein GspM [unclassified Pseudomonas]|uniref:type II secretion system protein GspM n=1 Tax=unclassified Pseudomonas TaxID=196821 RepID=UPI000DA8B35D|nr:MULTISPECIES: type II secretion system protein GspM [unclassified Pseudomonas]MDW3712249.1 type II secretion system protein GspM [Pseudomonas sp. 2023EL-01195]PZE13234.1 general secretion pathway protein GspM [Pseudomonas sp. 57B-090624]
MNPFLALQSRWRQLPARERRALLLLVLFLGPVLLWSALLQPQREALRLAEEDYQRALGQQVGLATLPQATPRPTLASDALPGLLTRTSGESRLAIERMDHEGGGRIDLGLEGALDDLLTWLQALEQAGAEVNSLGLEVSPEGRARVRLLVGPSA